MSGTGLIGLERTSTLSGRRDSFRDMQLAGSFVAAPLLAARNPLQIEAFNLAANGAIMGNFMDYQETEKTQAWIGDAVLALHVRLRVLREEGRVDGEMATRMSSNQFLSSVGPPDEIEAQIGRIYRKEGLEAAFLWIDRKLMPMFARQELKRRKR